MSIFDTNFDVWALYACLAYGILLLILLVQWIMSLGLTRGILSWICRAGWTLPLMATLFPRSEMQPLPRSLSLKPIRVLIDDSASMNSPEKKTSYFDQSLALMKELEKECLRVGCALKTTLLSELDPSVKLGFTSLNSHLDMWILRNPQDPWILISDGGDSQPTESWKPNLKGLGSSLSTQDPTSRGLIIGFEGPKKQNVWIKSPRLAPFSFENKPLNIKLVVGRNTTDSEEIVQVQVGVAPQSPTTINVKFKSGEDEVLVDSVLPALPRGQHLIEMRALPTATEQTIWDNTTYSQIEVLPNTFGILHLLGSPSWDGRFLRRYLKGEPKYDLISFFILRDPWDSQQVNERELSLIPFPVERLFKDELPNFRVVIIQNFTLFQFLLPEYQSNLVKFVQDGGGLLFIGGPRALHSADLIGSPLKAILPFEVDEKMAIPGAGGNFDFDGMGFDQDFLPYEHSQNSSPVAYDGNINFKVELAKPEARKRALANVYDDWENIEQALTSWNQAKGIHRMDRVRFKEQESTVLLHGITRDKNPDIKDPIPLAVASYPGKGRALWIFSDSFWRLGMNMNQDVSRQTYNNFMHSSMTWLMRQDLKKPLIVQSIGFSARPGELPRFHASLQGPSVKFFETGDEWTIKVCGVMVPSSRLQAHRQGENELELSGSLSTNIASGEICEFSVEGNHPAFGSVKASMTSVFPEIYRDSALQPVPHRLEDLAFLSQSRLLVVSPESKESPKKSPDNEETSKGKSSTNLVGSWDIVTAASVEWIGKMTGTEGVALPTKFKTLKDFYWIFENPWIYLVIVLIPIEILIRRWDEIMTNHRGHTPALKGRQKKFSS